MWKIWFLPTAINNLELYIERYREYFVMLYQGGGIWSEESIIEAHYSSSRDLYRAISEYIKIRMTSDILPFEELMNGMKKSVIFVRDRIIFLEYKEDTDLKLRIIHTITIQYK